MTLGALSSWWCARTAAVSSRLSLVVVLLMWAALSLPNLRLRAFHFEEGRNALHAMALIDSGGWVAGTVAGERFVVRLPLQPWAVRSFAAIVGEVDEWAVRLPALISVLGTLILVYHVVHGAADRRAASFAAAAFLTSIAIIPRLRLGEPDTAIMALSFAAFVVWFAGIRQGSVGWGRWLVCGLLMAAVCGFKGPQPCAYFLAGAGLFAVVRRRWAEIGGVAFVTVFPVAAFATWVAFTLQPGDSSRWLSEMRLSSRFEWWPFVGAQTRFAGQVLLEWLPPLLFAAPLWWGVFRKPEGDRDLPLALLLYAGTITLVLVAWPGARARYALPALPAVAAACGLGFHAMRAARPRLLAMAVTIGAGAAAFQLITVLGVMTLLPAPFTRNRDAARAMAHAIAERPAPVQLVFPAHNVAAYLGADVRVVSPDAAVQQPGAVWMLGLDAQIADLRRTNPRIEAPVPLPVVTAPPVALARLAPR